MNTPDFEVLVSQYKALNRRTKERIRQRFNEHFQLSDGDTTFIRYRTRFRKYSLLIEIKDAKTLEDLNENIVEE